MKKIKKIIIGSLFIIFLMLMLPSASSIQSDQLNLTRKSYRFKNLYIPPYIWFAIFILILAMANRINNMEL